MKSKYRLFLASILLFATMFGCKKFVDIAPPTTQLVTTSVFTNNSTATSALLAIYTQMWSNEESHNMSENNGLLSDELLNYSKNLSQVQFFTNAMTSVSAPGPWTHAYNYIYQANTIISALTNNTAISRSVANQLIGESKFVRAFWHFYLTNCYGNVPLVTTTDYTVTDDIARSPQAQVYQQVISDLQDAQSLLSSNYVDASDTAVTTERVRPTKWAATALLARVYLYIGDYQDAVTQATAVIENSSMFTLDSLNNVFLKNSTEAIWQLSTPLPASNNYNTFDAAFYILQGAPGSASVSGTTSLSSALLNSFEHGDYRLTHWIDSTSYGGDTYYFVYKYKVYESATISEYTMVLRLAEQYLIRAEAQAMGGGSGISGAIADLNIIRNRAGLPNYSGATDQGSLSAAILHERQVELFTEWGHRWFDLKRTGNVNTVLGAPGNVCESKGGSWSSSDSLYPIPATELSADLKLTQNAGY